MPGPPDALPTIDHAGFLEDLAELPAYLRASSASPHPAGANYSCAFCGVGDGASIEERTDATTPFVPDLFEGVGFLTFSHLGAPVRLRARLSDRTRVEVETAMPLVSRGGVLAATLTLGADSREVLLREVGVRRGENGLAHVQSFVLQTPAVAISQSVFRDPRPTAGCLKFRISMGGQGTTFPIHVAPSVLDPTGRRLSIGYDDAIRRLAELLLAHRPPSGRTLIYACGQVDYFTIFSFQEVFRLLGVRNLAGNAEHCLNAGAVHNEILTGQEGPFLTIDQALEGPGRLFLLNGWNGLITHPPVFARLMKGGKPDAWLVETVVTESAKMLAGKIGPERVLLVRSSSDPHLALAIAHEVLRRHPHAVDARFLDAYADRATFEAYAKLAREETFAPEATARRIAPEPAYVARLEQGIRAIAAQLARTETVPINLPSVGLSQTKGVVGHCLWGNLLAMLGKYGLKADGTPAGGTLRIPGQINAQTEVQGLSRRAFMGRIPVTDEGAAEAARRMGLPDDAYAIAVKDAARCALDYSDPVEPGVRELFICFGTQFESNMPGRSRWLKKLESPGVTLVVVDPIPDPYSLRRAALVIPSPPHVAAAKLYQNGEWRFTLSAPRKRARPDTRTDPTIVYDAMAEISRRLRAEPGLRAAHPDLARHAASGYLRTRFEDLPRHDGEVSRPDLWERVLGYMDAGEGRKGALYCRPEHADGQPIRWSDLLEQGSVVSGGVGTTRFRLDYDNPKHAPFRDLWRRPRRFTFFVPTAQDLAIPEGIILNSGRSTLSDDKRRIRFAIATFNSGKATSPEDMPDENPLCISPGLAARLGLRAGDRARVVNVETGESIVLPVLPTDRVKGDAAYVSFHKCKAELERGRYLNDVTAHTGRCPYTAQSSFKATRVTIEALP